MQSPIYVRAYTYEHDPHKVPWQLSTRANTVYQALFPPPPHLCTLEWGYREGICWDERFCDLITCAHVINSLGWCASWHSHSVLFECVLFYAVLCLQVAGCLEIKLKKEQVALQWVCLPTKHTCVQLSTNFSNSTTATAYQTFSLCTQP